MSNLVKFQDASSLYSDEDIVTILRNSAELYDITNQEISKEYMGATKYAYMSTTGDVFVVRVRSSISRDNIAFGNTLTTLAPMYSIAIDVEDASLNAKYSTLAIRFEFANYPTEKDIFDIINKYVTDVNPRLLRDELLEITSNLHPITSDEYRTEQERVLSIIRSLSMFRAMIPAMYISFIK